MVVSPAATMERAFHSSPLTGHASTVNSISTGAASMALAELERCHDPILGWNRRQLTEGRKL